MKKTIAIFLIVMMLFTALFNLTSCGKTERQDDVIADSDGQIIEETIDDKESTSDKADEEIKSETDEKDTEITENTEDKYTDTKEDNSINPEDSKAQNEADKKDNKKDSDYDNAEDETVKPENTKDEETGDSSNTEDEKENTEDEEESEILVPIVIGGEEEESTRVLAVVPETLNEAGNEINNVSMKMVKLAISADAEQGKNAMISPMSVLMMLALAENGAENNTLSQMEEAFGCNVDDMTNWLSIWTESITSGSITKTNVANSVWLRKGYKLSAKYTKSVKDGLNADIYEALFDQDTVKNINKWVKEETYDMIPKIIDSLSDDNIAVLLNAIAFDGKWSKNYEDYQIDEKGEFHTQGGKTQTVTMLNSTEHKYIEDESSYGVIKDYKEGFSFVAILPKEGITVSEYLSSFSGEKYRKLIDSLRYDYDVELKLPEFKYEYEIKDMKNTLMEMGITDLFDSAQSDLSGMLTEDTATNLYISQVIHKTFIELNREGTKAAAVTGGIVNATSIRDKITKQVILDRPFIYMIIDSETKTPIFVGTLMNVEQ